MVRDDLKKILEGDVDQSEETIAAYSKDASLFEIKPEAVVFPKSVHDLQVLVQYATAKRHAGENVSITARAAGTDMSGGPLTQSLVVGFTKYLNHIKEVTEDYAVVEPGVFYRDLEKEMDKKNVFLPSYPASKEMCALGGMLANNSGGEKNLAYGKTEKYIEEMKVVLSDSKAYEFKPLNKEELDRKMSQNDFEGGVYKKTYELLEKNYDLVQAAKPAVSKNSAGYALWNVWDRKTFNLAKLFVGSQGTLGLITEAKLKLEKKKPYAKMVVIFMKDIKILGQIVPEVLNFRPESFESYDRNTLFLALKFLPDLLKVMKGENIFSLSWNFLPEAGMLLTGGLPELVMLAELTGDDEAEVESRAEALMKALKVFPVRASLVKTESKRAKYWAIRRESFNLLRKRVKDKQTAPFIDDIIVRPERLPEFLPRLQKIMDQYKSLFTYTIAGHVGDGNFHIIPLMDLDDEKARKIIPVLSDEVYDLVLEFKGSITAEHNDGLIRSPYLSKMFGPEVYGFFEEIKKIFDPLDIFNPGKKVGSSLNFAFEHIKHMLKLEVPVKK